MSDLLKKLIKGNQKAQSEFYDCHSSMVMGVCMRYMKDYDLAADVFQDAFMKIFKNIGQVKEEKALVGWIRRVAVNTALDHLKTMRYDESVETVGHELSDGFYSDLLDRLSNEVVLDAIAKLPDGYRVIFNMNVIDGYSHKEIANQLQISEGTSRSQLANAKKALRKLLNELGITKYEQVI
ncbi:MAG: RNA polymerase sigma factor [Cyclobacteriaceae bacterium]